MRNLRALSLLFAAAAILGPVSGKTGTTGSVRGVVYQRLHFPGNDRGKPVEGARVWISSPYFSAQSTTDAYGRFGFFNIPPGKYVLLAGARNSAGDTPRGVCVHADENHYVDLDVIYPDNHAMMDSFERARSDLYSPDSSQPADLYSIGDC